MHTKFDRFFIGGSRVSPGSGQRIDVVSPNTGEVIGSVPDRAAADVDRAVDAGYIAKGRASGARVATGGGRPAGRDSGWFVEPTIFADVDNSEAIAREEIFGPVLAVIPYGDEDEAIAIANDSEYGLAGTVWTSDHDRGVAVARRVQSGTVGVNHYVPEPTSPIGGIKASGLGLEFGPEGLATYFGTKSIYL